MRVIFFRTYGYVTLFVILPILMGSTPDGPHSTLTFSERFGMLIGFGFIAAIGVGLMCLRKWAAIYFSVPLFCFGAWLALTSIEEISFPFNLGRMAFGASLMLPLFVTIRVWSQLTWGGGWPWSLNDAPRIVRALVSPKRQPAPNQIANLTVQFEGPEPRAWLIDDLNFQHPLDSSPLSKPSTVSEH